MALQGQVQAVLCKGAKLALKHRLELTPLLIKSKVEPRMRTMATLTIKDRYFQRKLNTEWNLPDKRELTFLTLSTFKQYLTMARRTS